MTPSPSGRPAAGPFDDGLLDLWVGIGLAAIGAAWSSGHVALGGLAPAVLVPLWIALHGREAAPAPDPTLARAGRGALVLGLGALLFFGTVAFWIGRGGRPPATLTALSPFLPAVIVGAGFVWVALALGLRRFGAYALGLLALAAGVVGLGGEPGAYLVGGGVLLVAGAGLAHARIAASGSASDRS